MSNCLTDKIISFIYEYGTRTCRQMSTEEIESEDLKHRGKSPIAWKLEEGKLTLLEIELLNGKKDKQWR